MLRPESEEAILILTGEEGPVTLPKSRIRHREKAPSAMPGGLADLMTLFEMRDLIEALERMMAPSEKSGPNA